MTQENTTQNEQVVEELISEAVAEEIIEEVIEESLSEVEKLAQELAEAKENNLRLMAEMQNVQRRSQEEIKKARDYAIANFAKEVITIRDYLEMALKDQSGNFEMLKMGVDMTLQQLVKAFEAQQIKEINPQAKDKLDANLHQAMSVVEEHDQEPNTVVSVMQKGYILNGRVLRAAMVTVAK
ncbi:MAG: nucleotide exchange factor GrpE [Neisseriaceae bacterium]|jgi:molecular chaperone GrpE|nr:MAG: nucleotide exchange factor GrpE [Neisseriaceae bacterium]